MIDLPAYATQVAEENGLNADHFSQVISCESGWDAEVVSPINTNGTWDTGLVQINSSWGFSKEKMDDPEFAINFMAEQWKAGNAHYWTCWRNYEKNGWE